MESIPERESQIREQLMSNSSSELHQIFIHTREDNMLSIWEEAQPATGLEEGAMVCTLQVSQIIYIQCPIWGRVGRSVAGATACLCSTT